MLTIFCREDARPPMTSSPIPAARNQYIPDLLAQVPDPRKRPGRRHSKPTTANIAFDQEQEGGR
ncbi:MAG: hypothetical protein ACRDN0_29970 [Trebonia sp.]